MKWTEQEKELIKKMLSHLSERISLTYWERNFIKSIVERDDFYLSDKQKKYLLIITEKCDLLPYSNILHLLIQNTKAYKSKEKKEGE